MNQPQKIILTIAVCAVCLLNSANIFAQTAPQKRTSELSFDVILQTVVASNNSAEKSNTVQSLSGVIKKLKSDFSFSNYRLTSTFMQRVSNNGNSELKSTSYEGTQDKKFSVFSEWTLNGLQSFLDETGRETFQIQNFRFGQRIPIVSDNGVVAYEPIGLTTRFSLPKDTPTVVGSLTTSKPDELMFLVLTVKSAEK